MAADLIAATAASEQRSWPGFLLSLEGLDGAGKSTQVASLSAALRADGDDVVVVRPSDTTIGELVRGFLLQHQLDVAVDPWAEAMLFIASRVQLLRETILPALKAGRVVIADRFSDSTLAYQGGGRGLPRDLLRELHVRACDDIWPELTILLDLPRAEAQRRQRAQELPIDRFEGEADRFHERVQMTFDELAAAEPERYVRVDASQPAVAVSHQILASVRERLAARRGLRAGVG